MPPPDGSSRELPEPATGTAVHAPGLLPNAHNFREGSGNVPEAGSAEDREEKSALAIASNESFSGRPLRRRRANIVENTVYIDAVLDAATQRARALADNTPAMTRSAHPVAGPTHTVLPRPDHVDTANSALDGGKSYRMGEVMERVVLEAVSLLPSRYGDRPDGRRD